MILQVAQAFGEICPIVIVGWLYTSFFKGLQMIGFIPPEPEDCNHLQPPHYRRTQTIHMTGIFAYSYHKKSTMHVGKICPAPWLLWIISLPKAARSCMRVSRMSAPSQNKVFFRGSSGEIMVPYSRGIMDHQCGAGLDRWSPWSGFEKNGRQAPKNSPRKTSCSYMIISTFYPPKQMV